MITVRDIIEQALPDETTVVAGEQGLAGEVTWATRPRPSPPAFGHLSGGELVLLTPKALSSLDERLTLDAAIRQLASFGVSAVGFAGRPTAAARSAANFASIPLIQLPPDADLALLEREASHLVAVRRRDAQRKGSETSRRLMELAIAGESLADLTTTLSESAQRDVFIVGRDGRLLAMTSPSGQVPSSTVIMPLLEAGRPHELDWLKTNPGRQHGRTDHDRASLGWRAISRGRTHSGHGTAISGCSRCSSAARLRHLRSGRWPRAALPRPRSCWRASMRRPSPARSSS